MPEIFTFTTEIPIRITEINYSGHIGNDSILSIIHEALVQFLRHHGYGELDIAGVGLIMADVTIEFKNELFYGDRLRASVAAAEFYRVGFDLYYKLEKEATPKSVLASEFDGMPAPSSMVRSEPPPAAPQWIPVSFARTGMVTYDYSTKKIAPVPMDVCSKLLA
jgi:acyl-CoA thioester hydrolase